MTAPQAPSFAELIKACDRCISSNPEKLSTLVGKHQLRILLACIREFQTALTACVDAAATEIVEDFSPVSNAADAALICIEKWKLP